MTIAEIKELMEALEKSELASLKYKNAEGCLELKKTGSVVEAVVAAPAAVAAGPAVAGPAPAKAAASTEQIIEVAAPSVGTFYKAPNPGSPAFVEVGSKVKENTVVCILEAMKLFSEIEAEVEGEVVEVLVQDGEFVEYGQPLFKIKCS